MRCNGKSGRTAAAWALAVILLCGLFSFGSRAEGGSNRDNRFNVAIVLDASGSMQNTDPQGYRYKAVSQFVWLLAEEGDVLGGVVFHNDVVKEQTPALVSGQEDKDAVTGAFKSVPANGGWTNTGAGLQRAVELLAVYGEPELPSVILFLSDGNTDMASDELLQASLDRKAEAIQQARERDISIYSVCLNANGKADVSEMQQISSATGGEFIEVSRAEDLQDVFNTFYNLIYGTSTIPLIDELFPESGRLEADFDVPGLGVEEVNIIIYGNTSMSTLINPDGAEYNPSRVEDDTFTMLKLTDVQPGTWTLVTEGVPGDSIKVNMIYNPNLSVELSLSVTGAALDPQEPVGIYAQLKGGDTAASSNEQYFGYSAVLEVRDAYGELVETLPMQLDDGRFELSHTFAEGVYYIDAVVSGNHIEKQSESLGPLTSAEGSALEAAEANTPPVPVNEVVEESVYIWPFKGGSYTLDMSTLATDAEDDVLDYRIVSSSFIENTDYTTDGSTLKLEHFSLSKGAFTIRATDSGGLSCDIEVIVKSYNVGIITLVIIGAAALVAAAIFAALLYIACTKPFRGTISAQSYCNGSYKGTPRNPRRGREKLSRFGMDNVGLDYQKCYFQATGQNYIFLVTNKPVLWNGQRTNKVRIQSGAEVTITAKEGDPRLLYVRFDSRMSARPPRTAAPRRGRKPPRPAGRR